MATQSDGGRALREDDAPTARTPDPSSVRQPSEALEDGPTRREPRSPSSAAGTGAAPAFKARLDHLIQIAGTQDSIDSTARRTNAYMQGLLAARIRPVLVLVLAIIPAGIAGNQHGRGLGVRLIHIGGLACVVAATFVLSHIAKHPERDPTRRKFNIAAAFLCASTLPLIYFYGPFLPFCGLIGLVLLLYNLSAAPFWGVLCTLVVAIPHALMHLSITFGLIPDVAMLSVDGPMGARLLNLFAIQVIYFLSLVIGQFYRKRTQTTLANLDEAARQVALREAMLREARLELEQAHGVGHPGRFTEQRLGSFVLGNIIGRGGMGEVYEAAHIESGEPAAVKTIRRPEGSMNNVLERFVREAEIAKSLRSPHVVRVFEIGGVDAVLPYIAMERLVGQDLAEILRERPRLPQQEILAMALEVAEGLGAAKELGVVHRDIKPRNLFRCADGTWKVLDFGVARLASDTGTLTGQGLIGTPAFMAPEQLYDGASIDHRTDIHALAAVIYRALTGQPAFHGREVAQVLQQVAESLPPSPSSLVAIPMEVDVIMRIALAKNPDNRFDDARTFVKALQESFDRGLDPELHRRASNLCQRLDWRETSRIALA